MASTMMLSSSSSSSRLLSLSSHLRVCPNPSNAQCSQSLFMPITRCSTEKPISSNTNNNSELDEQLLFVESEKQPPFKSSTVGATASPSPSPSPSPVTPRKAAPVPFQSVMAFNGAGPKTINGRLATLGFVWAVAREFASHETVLEQLSSGRPLLVAIMLLFSAASLIPLIKGKSPSNSNLVPFNAQVELLNGRYTPIIPSFNCA